MTEKQKKKLKVAIDNIVWMAIRYADGRHTYAPSDVRDSVKVFKEIFPDFKIKEDTTVKKPKSEEIGGNVI